MWPSKIENNQCYENVFADDNNEISIPQSIIFTNKKRKSKRNYTTALTDNVKRYHEIAQNDVVDEGGHKTTVHQTSRLLNYIDTLGEKVEQVLQSQNNMIKNFVTTSNAMDKESPEWNEPVDQTQSSPVSKNKEHTKHRRDRKEKRNTEKQNDGKAKAKSSSSKKRKETHRTSVLK